MKIPNLFPLGIYHRADCCPTHTETNRLSVGLISMPCVQTLLTMLRYGVDMRVNSYISEALMKRIPDVITDK